MQRPDTFKDFPKLRFFIGALIVLACFTVAVIGIQYDPNDINTHLNKLVGTDTLDASAVLVGHSLTGISFLLIAAMLCYLAIKAARHIPFQWSLVALLVLLSVDGISHILSSLFLLNDSIFEASLAVSRIASAFVAVAVAASFPPLINKRLQLYEDAARYRQQAELAQDRNEDLEAEVQDRTEHARYLTGQVVESEQREKVRLSHDVHDGVTQTAVAAHQNLQAFSRAFYDPALIQDKHSYQELLNTCLLFTKQTVRDCRAVIDDLSPTILADFGLPAAIEHKIAQYRERGWSIDFHLSLPDEQYTQRVDENVEMALYRVCLEALNNISKHSQATHVDIHLELTGVDGGTPEAYLEIRDNGIGFELNPSDGIAHGPGEKVGLNSMRERLKNLGGQLTINSHPGTGTVLCATIPFAKSNYSVHGELDDDDDGGEHP